MRADDEPASRWIDLGPHRAHLQALSARQVRFWVHGKPDFSAGYARGVVLTSGWIEDGSVSYWVGVTPLDEALERELTAAVRRLGMRALSTND